MPREGGRIFSIYHRDRKKKEKFVSNIFWHIAASLECRPIISRVCCKEEGVAGVVYPSSDALWTCDARFVSLFLFFSSTNYLSSTCQRTKNYVAYFNLGFNAINIYYGYASTIVLVIQRLSNWSSTSKRRKTSYITSGSPNCPFKKIIIIKKTPSQLKIY